MPNLSVENPDLKPAGQGPGGATVPVFHNWVRSVTEAADERFGHTQPWPLQFRRRALEVEALSRLHDLSGPRRILELGCGNAFGSALMAERRERVVATDLARVDVRTHSIGLKKARDLLDGLGLGWCEVVGASGDRLPFADRSFDLVFSLFVLEHIRDREACLAEMRRVLDDDGLAVHAVPGLMWAATAPPRFHLYLLRRLLARLRGERGVDPGSEGSGPAAGTPSHGSPLPARLWRTFRRRYPQFPLPPPHAEYDGYFHELISSSRGRWVRLFERNGFEVLECRPTMVLPLDLGTMLVGDPGFELYERLFGVDRWLVARRWLSWSGQFFGVVARKRR